VALVHEASDEGVVRGQQVHAVAGPQTVEVEPVRGAQAEKQRFEDPDCRVILLQADAGKYGHTLVGTEDDPCGTMLFFENTYSLDTRSQIEDRIHRMGTVAESCLYVDLSGSDIDERIARALQRKEAMFLSIFPDVKFQKEAA